MFLQKNKIAVKDFREDLVTMSDWNFVEENIIEDKNTDLNSLDFILSFKKEKI